MKTSDRSTSEVGDGFADLPLVAVGGGGVDVAVAGLEGGLHDGSGLIRRGLVHAEAEGRQLDVIVESEHVHRERPFVPQLWLSLWSRDLLPGALSGLGEAGAAEPRVDGGTGGGHPLASDR